MPSIIVRDQGKAGRVLKSTPYSYEDILQRNVSELPNLVPLEAVTDEAVLHVTIGVEWPAGTGAADVILIGSDAVLTIVETKLKRNPEARREVIAQLLEYAAYITEWTIYEIQRRADDFLKSEQCTSDFRDKSFNEILQSFAEESDETVESFKGKVEQNLRQGRVRLIVAVDEVGEHAQKIVNFVNSYSSFDLYLLQISSYEDSDGRQIFVPSLFGYARKVSPTRQRVQWNWDKYQSELGWTAEQVDIARLLNDRLVSNPWQAEWRFNRGWTTFYVGGKALYGVTKSNARGVELWFRLDTKPDQLPPAIRPHSRGKGYVYLGGRFEDLTEEHLHRICRSSMTFSGIEFEIQVDP